MRLIMDRNLITGFLIFFMLLTGCDGLDVAPTGSVTEDNYWQRVSDVEQAVNGVYVDMDGGRWDWITVPISPLVCFLRWCLRTIPSRATGTGTIEAYARQ